MSKSPSVAVCVIAILAATIRVSCAQPVSPAFCAAYAQTAVDQYQKAVQHPQCNAYVAQNRLRWQPIYQNHYNGCMYLGRTVSELEQETRRVALADCAPGN